MPTFSALGNGTRSGGWQGIRFAAGERHAIDRHEVVGWGATMKEVLEELEMRREKARAGGGPARIEAQH